MDLTTVLERVGLTDKEARIYIALLEIDEAKASTLASRARIKRPTVYVILENLKDKGLISSSKKGNTQVYKALNPILLQDNYYKRYRDLEKSIPELTALRSKYMVKPQMTIFEGKEGLMNIMEDTLTTKTELLCWADITLAVESVLKDYYATYITKKVERKLWLRGIFSYDKLALDFKKRGEEELREIYLIPKNKFPFQNEINIYDNKMAIISHQDKIGVIIENKNIADTQRAIFEFGFEYAKILEKELLTAEDRRYLSNSTY